MTDKFDEKQIVSKMTNLLQTKSQALKLHILYAGNYYNNDYFEYKLHSLFLRFNLFESAMITMLRMQREHLITKENVKLLTKGLRIGKSPLYTYASPSDGYRGIEYGNRCVTRYGQHVGVTTLTGVCDDLESFFEKIVAGKYSDKFEETKTYFLPSLTDEEMQLVEMKDKNHLETYSSENPDVGKKEMKLSDSKHKYVNCSCERKTFLFDRNARTIDLPQRSKKCQIM